MVAASDSSTTMTRLSVAGDQHDDRTDRGLDEAQPEDGDPARASGPSGGTPDQRPQCECRDQHAEHVECRSRGVVPGGKAERIAQQPRHAAELEQQQQADRAGMIRKAPPVREEVR